MLNSASPHGLPRNRRTSLSQSPTVLNGTYKEATGSSSPERRLWGGRVGKYFSHRPNGSIPASPSAESVTSNSPNRTPERRPYKARKSSFGEEGSPVQERSLHGIPSPSPAARRRSAAGSRVLRMLSAIVDVGRHQGRLLLSRPLRMSMLLLFLLGIILYTRITAHEGSLPVPSKANKPKPGSKSKSKSKKATIKTRKTSHTYVQLARLESTLTQPHTATIAAVIVCENQQAVNLRPLLASLEAQTLPPSEAVVLCELDSTELLSTPGLTVSISSSEAPETAIAIIETARKAHADFLFVMDASTSPLSREHLDTLVHAAGTVEYSAALLTTAGLAYTEAEEYLCLPWSPLDEASTAVVHLPSAPYLVQRTWLTAAEDFDSGMLLDVPHGHAMAVALWLKSSIGCFALPLAQYSEPICETEVQVDTFVAASFLADRAVSTGHARSSEEYLESRDKGLIIIAVADFQELLALAGLACGYAESPTATVRVLLREGMADPGQLPCYLDVRKGRAIDAITADVLIYASHRAAPSPELLAINARTAAYKGKGWQAQPGPTAIYVPAETAEELDWAGTLDFVALKNWHRPRIELAIITNNRPDSLSRLLRSLTSAEYYGDHVSLSISLEQTADVATHRLIESFEWPHGAMQVRHRVIMGGLMPAITEAWYPASNDSYGVFLEDDVELSPLFYGWLKYTILKYRYSGAGADQLSKRLYGISMYQQKALELRPEGRRPFDAHILLSQLDLPSSTPYLSQVPCSWGAVYFPEVWREFHHYLALRLSEVALDIADTLVPDIRSNRWPRSWKKYFIELVYARGYSMLYPNYPDWMSFSTNHLEAGTHIRSSDLVDAKRKAQFQVPLAPRSASLLEGLPQSQLPGWHALPMFDLWGSMATEDELVGRGWRTLRDLGICALPSRAPSLPSFNAGELLCQRSGR